MSGIISFLRSRKLGKEGLIMGAARIMFHRSDVAKEFRATAHKALDEWIDELEESFESNPAPNVMDFPGFFSKAGLNYWRRV